MRKKREPILTAKQVSNNVILQDMIESLFNPNNKTNKWKKPWDAKNFKLQGHINPFTGSDYYQGSNAFFLAFVQMKNGYKSFLWLTTLNGINLFGKDTWCKIIKGQKASNVFKPFKVSIEKTKSGKPELDDNGNPIFCSFLKYKYSNVFNFSQIVGKDKEADKIINEIELKHKIDNAPKKEIPLNDLELALIKGIDLKGGVNIKAVDMACYSKTFDAITMPLKESFKNNDHFLTTLFHESGHSTGHESRLNRDMTGSFGSMKYSFEELIVELGSTLLDDYYGIKSNEISDNHKAYLDSWYQGLKKNPTKLISACSNAEKVFDYITTRTDVQLEIMKKKVA